MGVEVGILRGVKERRWRCPCQEARCSEMGMSIPHLESSNELVEVSERLHRTSKPTIVVLSLGLTVVACKPTETVQEVRSGDGTFQVT